MIWLNLYCCDEYIFEGDLVVSHLFSDLLLSFIFGCWILKSFSMKIKSFFFFFYLGFLSRTFTIHGTAGKGGGYLFNSSLPLPLASQTLRHYPGDYSRELTSAHSWQPDSNWEPLVSKRKSLTTKPPEHFSFNVFIINMWKPFCH